MSLEGGRKHTGMVSADERGKKDGSSAQFAKRPDQEASQTTLCFHDNLFFSIFIRISVNNLNLRFLVNVQNKDLFHVAL